MTLLTPVSLRLKRDLLRGGYVPGERLIERDLIERYVAERADVRTALGFLERDGLVVHERNLGARVKQIGFGEATDIAHTLSVLESAAISRACGVARDDDIRQVRLLLDAQAALIRGGMAASALDQRRELRDRLYDLAGSPASGEAIGLLDDRRVLFLHRFESPESVVAATCSYHRRLVEAIAARDVATALTVVDWAAGMTRAEIRRREVASDRGGVPATDRRGSRRDAAPELALSSG